ncbi:MAG: hypothetical protein COB38_05855 [Gammaproteobacteria bacterium]|nr:MAG: hypothetical protein COB38_05855 [Gammaproteobacteria bacterium]
MRENTGFTVVFDEDVIQSAICGDHASFEKIYNQYYRSSLSLAFRITGNAALAQDITQESFFNIFKNIQKYKGEGSFSGWVRRIICNQSITLLTKNSKMLTDQDDLIFNLESKDLFETDWCDAKIDLVKVMKILSQESRAVLVLHEVEGFTHKEIGKLFNKSESFSKSVLSRAYVLLKDSFVAIDYLNINKSIQEKS